MCVIIDRLSTLKCVLVILSQLRWARDFLLDPSFYSDKIPLPEIFVNYEELRMKYYEKKATDDDEDAECSICLCHIEEGDEVRELNCSHFFHRVCLDRWLGHGRLTCPLCRGNLLRLRVPGVSSAAVGNRETLFFNFSDVGSRERDKWWLR